MNPTPHRDQASSTQSPVENVQMNLDNTRSHATLDEKKQDPRWGFTYPGVLTAIFFAITLMLHDIGLVIAVAIALVGLAMGLRDRSIAPHWLAWTREDTLLTLTFVSPFVFKLLAASWSVQPALGLENAGWHVALVLWPLVLLFYARSRVQLTLAWFDHLGAALLLTLASWAILGELQLGIPNPMYLGRFHLNSGVYSQMIAVLVVWALLAATRPQASATRKGIHLVAWMAGMGLIVWMNRRIELLAALGALAGIAYWRWGRGISGGRILLIALALALATLWGLFQFAPKFSLAVDEVQRFFATTQMSSSPLGSVDTRLEIYGRAWKAFWENPWFGHGSGVRPYLLGEYAVVFNGDPSAFNHRHFHSMWVEMMMEGGIAWTAFACAALGFSLWIMVIKRYAQAPEISLALGAIWWVYGVEGLTSANLVYGAPTVFWVVSTAFLWQLKRQSVISQSGQAR